MTMVENRSTTATAEQVDRLEYLTDRLTVELAEMEHVRANLGFGTPEEQIERLEIALDGKIGDSGILDDLATVLCAASDAIRSGRRAGLAAASAVIPALDADDY